jgi:putative hemolysin
VNDRNKMAELARGYQHDFVNGEDGECGVCKLPKLDDCHRFWRQCQEGGL